MITIATKDDLSVISQLAKDISSQAASEKELELQDENLEIYVYKIEGKIIGYISIRKEIDEAEIDEIVITQAERHQGYGYKFIQEILQSLQNKGIKKVFLEVRKKNTLAIRLYEKCGFKAYRVRKNYYQDDDAICYLKELEL